MKLLGAVLACVVALAACSSSGGSTASTSPAPATPTQATHVPTGLTGYGATRAEWDASHDANPDPNLSPGCCYGPQVDAPDNGGAADTWNIAGSTGSLIDLITHNFAPNTDAAEALAAVVTLDLPDDVTMVREDTSDPTCYAASYHSDELAAADPSLGGNIEVSLYSSVTTDTYDVTDVRSAQISPGSEATC